jgi:translation elongation factor EF-G
VPLSALVGYAAALRSLTAGHASLSMVFSRYVPPSHPTPAGHGMPTDADVWPRLPLCRH